MPRINVVAGDISQGDWELSQGILSGGQGSWGEPISINLAACTRSVDIQTEQQAKNFLAATGASIGGAVAGAAMTSFALLPWAIMFPPLGALALVGGGAAGLLGGAMAGGNKKLLCVVVGLHDGRKFMTVVQPSLYQMLYSFITSPPFEQCSNDVFYTPSASKSNGKRMPTSGAIGTPKSSTEFKACPFCAEQIKRAAVLCKHCKSQVPVDLEDQLEAIETITADLNIAPGANFVEITPAERVRRMALSAQAEYSNHQYKKAEKKYRECLSLALSEQTVQDSIDFWTLVEELEAILRIQGKELDADALKRNPKRFVKTGRENDEQLVVPSHIVQTKPFPIGELIMAIAIAVAILGPVFYCVWALWKATSGH